MRILIFRPDNIGDVVLFSGAFKHIRNRFPDAEITLAVQEHILNLVELCPSVDKRVSLENLTWPLGAKGSLASSFPRCEAAVRRLERSWKSVFKQYDLVIYPVRSPQPRHLSILYNLGIRNIRGITGCTVNRPREGYPGHTDPRMLYSSFLDVSGADPWRHEFYTTLDFLKFLGCEVATIEDIRPEMWLAGTEKDFLDTARATDRTIVGLFPGASFNGRSWHPDRYESLAKLMRNALTYVLFGGSDNSLIARQVGLALKKGRPGIEVINLVGRTTLRELYKAISSCSLFIGMETSGLHLAITADVPTIALLGGGHYGRFAPWGEPDRHISLTNMLECFHCNWKCTRDRSECIQGVAPADVAARAEMLLPKG